jgi:hypothetical protein
MVRGFIQAQEYASLRNKGDEKSHEKFIMGKFKEEYTCKKYAYEAG